MQMDFHYCAMKVLAFQAGFSKEDAEIIAFASQYVDDACEHKPLRVAGLPQRFRANGNRLFDPTCTAWDGINYFRTFYTDVQRKVFIPFHFLPGSPIAEGQSLRRLLVQPASRLAKQLMDASLAFWREQQGGVDRLAAMIRLGITLHTFADTFSHQHFSGRHSYAENQRFRVQTWSPATGKWKRVGFFRQWLVLPRLILPSIGHANAYDVPDWPGVDWRVNRHCRARLRTHSNPQCAIDACAQIFTYLQQASGTTRVEWSDFEQNLMLALSAGSGKKPKEQLKVWAKKFPELAFTYDLQNWRRLCLKGPVRWEWWPSVFYGVPKWEYAGADHFFHFHEQASWQRVWVLERVARHQGFLGGPWNHPWR